MKYILTIRDVKIDVPYLEYGIDAEGVNEGWADLYIRVRDNEQDIYTDPKKKSAWIEWLDSCCGQKDNPQDHVRRVMAEIKGGDGDDKPFRTITIQHGYISYFKEISIKAGASIGYEAEIRRAPHKTGEVTVK